MSYWNTYFSCHQSIKCPQFKKFGIAVIEKKIELQYSEFFSGVVLVGTHDFLSLVEQMEKAKGEIIICANKEEMIFGAKKSERVVDAFKASWKAKMTGNTVYGGD